MRPLVWFTLLLVPASSGAWNTRPHQIIARAALDSLPRDLVLRFQAQTGPMAEIYCLYPDRYLEMTRFGFVRKSPGPSTPVEIRDYCLRPDGMPIHGITGYRETDIGTLAYLMERITASLKAGRPADAAKYAGVLSHFAGDSLCPSHAASAEKLRGMRPWFTCARDFDPHSAIERSLPEFALGGRRPSAAGATFRDAAGALVGRCYEGAALNYKDLPVIVKAACPGDETRLNFYRLRAGRAAAEILSDALYTILAAR